MRQLRRAMIVGLLSLLVALPAAAAVGRLKGAKAFRKVDLHAYTQVVVVDLADAVEKRPEDAEDQAEYTGAIAAAAKSWADNLAERFRASNKFESVERAAHDGEHVLVVGGRITGYRQSNAAGRYIGLGAGSRFEGVIELKDGASGKLLGTIAFDFTSDAIPGVANVVQTVARFIDGTAQRTHDEVLIAKGALFREETGRSGRLREKYNH